MCHSDTHKYDFQNRSRPEQQLCRWPPLPQLGIRTACQSPDSSDEQVVESQTLKGQGPLHALVLVLLALLGLLPQLLLVGVELLGLALREVNDL